MLWALCFFVHHFPGVEFIVLLPWCYYDDVWFLVLNKHFPQRNMQPSKHDTELDIIVESKCKKQACAFQYCLVKYNHDRDPIGRCQSHYQAYEDCAANVRENLVAAKKKI